jgi:hypothetical protein
MTVMLDPTKITLEHGEAKKSIFELTHNEIEEVGRKIFEQVLASSLKLSSIPAIGRRANQILVQCIEEVTGVKKN